jgi:hypothetical protein
VLATTIAGSPPKPAWLAAPETLWAPWRLPREVARAKLRALGAGAALVRDELGAGGPRR